MHRREEEEFVEREGRERAQVRFLLLRVTSGDRINW